MPPGPYGLGLLNSANRQAALSHLRNRPVHEVIEQDGFTLIGGKLVDRQPNNGLVGRLLHGILRFGTALCRYRFILKIGHKGVFHNLGTVRGTDVIYENRPHPVIERAGLTERADVSDGLVEGPEHKIFGFGRISAKLNGITQQPITVFRNQLHGTLLKVIAYVLYDSHSSYLQ